MLNFDFSEESGNSFSLHHLLFIVFQKNVFHVAILLTDQISLSDCLNIRHYVSCAINFEINLIFLIKPFFYMNKK